MLLLNTDNRMDIVEEAAYSLYNLTITDDFFNLTCGKLKKKLNDLVEELRGDNMVIRLLFDEPTELEEVEETIDLFIDYFVDAIILEQKEQQKWQPRNSLVDRLHILLNSQIKLLNHKTKINNFNIMAYYKNEKIYEMIE